MRLTSHLDCAQPITEFGRKDAFVVDGPLGVCHDVVDVLRCRQPDLFALLVDPCVLSSKKKKEKGLNHQQIVYVRVLPIHHFAQNSREEILFFQRNRHFSSFASLGFSPMSKMERSSFNGWDSRFYFFYNPSMYDGLFCSFCVGPTPKRESGYKCTKKTSQQLLLPLYYNYKTKQVYVCSFEKGRQCQHKLFLD